MCECILDGKIYLFGGRDNNRNYSNDLYCFEPRKPAVALGVVRLSCRLVLMSLALLLWARAETRVWTRLAVVGSVPIARCHHTLSVSGKSLYMYGGSCHMEEYNRLQMFYEYNTGAWLLFAYARRENGER